MSEYVDGADLIDSYKPACLYCAHAPSSTPGTSMHTRVHDGRVESRAKEEGAVDGSGEV